MINIIGTVIGSTSSGSGGGSGPTTFKYTSDKLLGILVGGQSNAVGTNSPDVPPAELQFPISNVFIRTTGSTFDTIDYPINNQGANFGPELSIAKKIKEYYQRPVYMAKVAVSGAPIAIEAGRQDFNVATNELYPLLQDASLALRNKIISLGKTPVIVLLWIQGERDTLDTTTAGQYYTNFMDIYNLANTNGAKFDYVIMNYLKSTQDAGTTETRGMVIANQQLLVSNNSNFVGLSMEPYPLGSDVIHYTGPGQISIGQDAGQRIIDNIFTGGYDVQPYVIDAQSAFDRMATPLPTAYKTAINNYIIAETTAGNWPYISEIQCRALDTEANSLIGWKGKANATNNGAVHTPKVGFDYNGTSAYVNTGYIPSTMGTGNLTTGNSVYGAYVVTNDSPTTDRTILGAFGTTTSLRVSMSQTPSVSNMQYRVNSSTSGTYTGKTAFSANSYYQAKRNAVSGATATTLYENGVALMNNNTTAGGLPDVAIFEGATNNNGGGAVSFFDGKIAFFSVISAVSSDLTLFNFSAHYTNVSNLLTALSAI